MDNKQKIDAEEEKIRRGIHQMKPPPPYKRNDRKPKLGKKILVIPDSHAKPGIPNHRYEWLGRMVVDIKPDYVVNLGDLWDMHSLNSFEKPGSKSFNGASYWKDIDVGLDGMLRFHNQIDEYNKGTKEENKYNPELIFCMGNHENRISKFIDSEPRFEEIISTKDLRLSDMGWEEVPFLVPKKIHGCSFAHYFTSGVMGRPISGLHQAASLLTKQFGTCIQGHTHTYDHSVRTDSMGKSLHGLVAGCYFEHSESWAGPANQMWRRGLSVLHNVKSGDFDVEWIGMERIKAKYS
jgi:predicted phosphodiesterase